MSDKSLFLAVVQMTSAGTIKRNVDQAEKTIHQAHLAGVDLVCFPECANILQQDESQFGLEIRSETEDPFLACCRTLAAKYGIWIHTGSLALREPGQAKCVNRSVILNPTGTIVARYDKIHLFDADLGLGNVNRESDRYQPGDRAVLVETPWGKWGLSICYDLRFPHLYRAYAKAGASILFIPAAFTVPTGMMHWHALIRARAIENGCYVAAPAQCGLHEDGRSTYGHSMVVDPWGETVVELGSVPGLVTARLDMQKVAEVRRKVPSLANERPFTL